jgi:hypothetical protein
VSLRFLGDPYRDLAATSFTDSAFAISRSCNALDRLSPLSVLTAEFQIHRQVQGASILAKAFLSGASLRFVGDPSRDLAATSYIDSAFAISRSCNLLDRLSPLSHLKGHFFGVWSNTVATGTGFLQFGLKIRHV